MTPDDPVSDTAPPADAAAPAAPANPSRAAIRRLKYEDAVRVLPAVGLLLFVSPVLDAVSGKVLGVPARVAMIFLAWLALIMVCRILSRRLADMQPGPRR